MKNDKPYREWWIDPNEDLESEDCDILQFDAFNKHPGQGDLLWQSQLVHAIEYSAFEAMQKRFDASQETVGILAKKITELEAENENLKANQLRSFDVAVPSDEWYDTIKERDQLRQQAEKLASALDGLKNYADNIQRDCIKECSHGSGYSLLGQLAQQVSTDGYYALQEYNQWKNRGGE